MDQKITELLRTHKTVAGIRQVLKAAMHNLPWCVILAKDVDAVIASKVQKVCKEKGIEILFVQSKRELGKQAGLAVDCATIAILQG